MTTEKRADFTKDIPGRKILVAREFEAPVEQVWHAWTRENLLDAWWAPRPWKAITSRLNFTEGGQWLYAMQGPDGTQTWCKADFKTIVPFKCFTVVDGFCDANGKEDTDMPLLYWKIDFEPVKGGTRVSAEISFNTEVDLNRILEMGFQEGFTAALSNLDEVLSS